MRRWLQVDAFAPHVEIVLGKARGFADRGPVDVTERCYDAASGCREHGITVDGAQPTTPGGAVHVTREGRYKIRATARDAVGYATTLSRELIIDRGAPEATMETTSGSVFTRPGERVTGFAEDRSLADGSPGSGADQACFTVREIRSGHDYGCIWAERSEGSSFSLLTRPPNGIYELAMRAVDAAGNSSPTSPPVTVIFAIP